jgi:hypothetical protein
MVIMDLEEARDHLDLAKKTMGTRRVRFMDT